MKVIGLTGSIGMGKSETARMLRVMGVPVFDSDAAVHALTARNGPALPAIAARFPGVVENGVLDRRKLGAIVFKDPSALKILERILHPMVGEKRERFIAAARRAGWKKVVLDVPLLFETGGDKRCDAVLVVSAPAFIQRQRVLRRPGMSAEKLTDILKRQMPDAEKRKRADRVIHSGLGRAVTWRELSKAMREL